MTIDKFLKLKNELGSEVQFLNVSIHKKFNCNLRFVSQIKGDGLWLDCKQDEVECALQNIKFTFDDDLLPPAAQVNIWHTALDNNSIPYTDSGFTNSVFKEINKLSELVYLSGSEQGLQEIDTFNADAEFKNSIDFINLALNSNEWIVDITYSMTC